jgi:hypothetical protein
VSSLLPLACCCDALVCQAINAAGATQAALGGLFDRIEHFFKRLEVYIEIPPPAGLTNIIVEIMVEVISVLALATKEITGGKRRKAGQLIYGDRNILWLTPFSANVLKNLLGINEISDALGRLDNLAREELWMVAAQNRKSVHDVGIKVDRVDDGAQSLSIQASTLF